MNEEKSRFIWALIFLVTMVGGAIYLALQTQDSWTLEDRVAIYVVTAPFLVGSFLGGCFGNHVRAELFVLISFLGGNIVLYLINSLPLFLLSEPSSIFRLIVMVILWGGVGAVTGYRAVRFIHRRGSQAYFFVLGVTFTATALTAILVEGPFTQLLDCLRTTGVQDSSSLVIACKVFDIQSEWNTYSLYLTAGVFSVLLTGREMTRVGFHVASKRFFQIVTVLGFLEFLVEFFTQEFASTLVWLIPQLHSPESYRGVFALVVAGLLAFPLNAEKTLRTPRIDIFSGEIGKMKREHNIVRLTEFLAHRQASKRRRAAQALGDLGDPNATQPLITALRDDDDAVQVAVIQALGKLKDDRAVQPLIRILRQPYGGLHEQIEVMLGSKQTIGFAPEDSTAHLRIAATKALEMIGGPKAIEALSDALRDGNEAVRDSAEDALDSMGGEMATEVVERYRRKKEYLEMKKTWK